MLTTIRLYGKFGTLFGRVHRVQLDTNTPAEAVRYLCSQFPAARAYLTQAKDKGVGFAVFRGKENIDEDQLRDPVGNDDIRIAPIIMGSKNGGVFQIILGAVLIVIGGLITGWSFGAATPLGTAIAGMGASMIVGGVVQMLTPMPQGPSGTDRPDNQPSYVFTGAVNTQAQGNPVPLLYGRMIVGSAVVSAGLNAEDYAPVDNGVGNGQVFPPGYNPKYPNQPIPQV